MIDAAGVTRRPLSRRPRRWLALLLVLLVLPSSPAHAEPTPAAPTVAAPTGSFGWPVAGTPPVTRPFDPSVTRYGPGHRGADLGASPGDAVFAAGAGVVVFAGVVAGRPVVSVDHPGGLRTTYEPVTPVVAAGQVVVRGSPLGTLVAGHLGCPVVACLHWGLRRGEVYLDPLSLLQPPRVRLLPWA